MKYCDLLNTHKLFKPSRWEQHFLLWMEWKYCEGNVKSEPVSDCGLHCHCASIFNISSLQCHCWRTGKPIFATNSLHKLPFTRLGCYSETGFHIVMDGNFVCLWRRHNCNWSLTSALISLFMKSIIGFLNNSNLHAIIFTLLLNILHWVYKIYFAVLAEIYNNAGQQF